MQAAADDAPSLLTRDDLRLAAARAAAAGPLLVAWATRVERPRPSAFVLGLGLAVVVGGAALVERAGQRRGWTPLRTALVVWLVALVGAFAAGLQAQGSGLEVLADGAGGARVDAALGRIALDHLEGALRLPAALASLLAGVALTADLRARGAPRGVCAAAWSSCAVISFVAPWLIMDGGREEWRVLPLHAGALVVVGALVLASSARVGWLALHVLGPTDDRRRPSPVRDRPGAVELALAAAVLLALLAPRAGRLAHDVRRANAASEAERLLQDALALDDPRAALRLLDEAVALGHDPRAELARGRRRVEVGDIAGAEADFESASYRSGRVDADPTVRLDALVACGDALFLDYDRALTAIERYSRALEVLDELRDDASLGALDAVQELALVHAGLVRHALRRRFALHVTLRDDLLARGDADRLLEAEFGAPGAWLRRALLRALVGDRAGARADLERAAEAGSEDAVVWLAAVFGEGGERLEVLAGRPGLAGAAARTLAPAPSQVPDLVPEVVAPDERALLAAASAAGDARAVDDALSTALAWLGAQAERTGDLARARARYASALAPCARLAGAGVKRAGPGEHPGRVWAWRRLEALKTGDGR